MQVVKTKTIESQFRKKGHSASPLKSLIASLEVGEALVISAKEADVWKHPSNNLRTQIRYGQINSLIPRNAKYSVKTLKSGSYAVVRISK